MEIQSIKNQQSNGGENWHDIAKEFHEFNQKYWVENVLNDKAGLNNLDFNDAQEYYNTVRRTMISYCDRILDCLDLPNDMREFYQNQKLSFMADLNYYATESNHYKQTNGQKTESFNDVIAEMRQNVPDSTSTISEKQLALSYIERMLSCDDIPNAEYWENKRTVIEMEIQNIKNEQQINQGEKVEDVWKEFQEFQKNYLNSLNDNMSIEQKFENRAAYYNAIFSFVARLVNCTDVTESQMAAFSNLEYQADIDLTGWERDFEEYQKYSS